MATVWAPLNAPRIGQWQDHAYGSGWSDTIHFDNLRGLVSEMNRRNLAYSVSRLGIVAHGDRPGVVQLDRTLRSTTVRDFREELQLLRSYLTPNGQFAFYSCIAGQGPEGDELLCAISRHLPGRTVIGFTTFGLTSASEMLSGMAPMRPGNVRPSSGLGQAYEGHGTMDPYDVFAKWAMNGQIIRDAPVERDEERHCANPQCPGHAGPTDNCPNWPR